MAWGVEMEAWSVEDNGAGRAASTCYVLQRPARGVTIDYATGDSWAEGENTSSDGEITYILNTSSLRFHEPDCAGAARIAPANRQETHHRQPGAPPGPGVPALRNLQTVTGTPDRNGHPLREDGRSLWLRSLDVDVLRHRGRERSARCP